MVDIDQFEGNRPNVFTPNCGVEHCLAASLKTLALLRRRPARTFGQDANKAGELPIFT
jgi:hypothetical protein